MLYLKQKHFLSINKFVYYQSFLFIEFLIILFSLPTGLIVTIGIFKTNFFSYSKTLQGSLLLAPFIKFRLTTRGEHPEFIRNNVFNNIHTCLKIGFDKFQVEIISKKSICVQENQYIQEKIIDSDDLNETFYKIDSNLIDFFEDDSWILFINEDFIFTEQVLFDIINFSMLNEKHIAIGTVKPNLIEPNFENVNLFYKMGQNLVLRHFFSKFPILLNSENLFLLCKKTLYNNFLIKQLEFSKLNCEIDFLNFAKNEGYTIDWIREQMIIRQLKSNNYSANKFLKSNQTKLNEKMVHLLFEFCLISFKYSFLIFFVVYKSRLELLTSYIITLNSCLYIIGFISSSKLNETKDCKKVAKFIIYLIFLPIVEIWHVFFFIYEISKKLLSAKQRLKFNKIEMV